MGRTIDLYTSGPLDEDTSGLELKGTFFFTEEPLLVDDENVTH